MEGSERQSLFIKEISSMATALLRGTNDILINVNWALGYLFSLQSSTILL